MGEQWETKYLHQPSTNEYGFAIYPASKEVPIDWIFWIPLYYPDTEALANQIVYEHNNFEVLLEAAQAVIDTQAGDIIDTIAAIANMVHVVENATQKPQDASTETGG